MPPKNRATANQTKEATYPVVEQPVAPVVANQNVSVTWGSQFLFSYIEKQCDMAVPEETFNMAENFIIVHHQRII